MRRELWKGGAGRSLQLQTVLRIPCLKVKLPRIAAQRCRVRSSFTPQNHTTNDSTGFLTQHVACN